MKSSPKQRKKKATDDSDAVLELPALPLKGPPVILAKDDLEGLCDLCSQTEMPPGGGLINALAMRILVERGFDPSALSPITNETLNEAKPEDRANLAEMILAGYRAGALGDFAVCPACFKSVTAFARSKAK